MKTTENKYSLKRLFGDTNMTWPRVILFAIVAGLYTGAVMLIPFLKDTSFQDIGINYEWWVIFAIIIVVNCKKGWEAMLKCFVFFLVSQPLVYIVEIIAGSLPFDMGWSYYRSIWLPMTMLTLPGGFIAYFCQKQNALGATILGLGNTIQAVLAVYYLGMAIKNFPHHILSALVCLGSIIVMSISIQKEGKNRLIAILLPIMLTATLLLLIKLTGRVLF